MLTHIELSNLSTDADRALGSVMGALIGDAAGGIFEFMGRPPTLREAQAALNLPGGGVFDLAPGQFTDDGEMTMALLGAIDKGKGAYRQELAAHAYCEWEQSNPFDIGLATRAALSVPKAAMSNSKSLAKLVCSQALEHNSASKANGCMMRATPLGIAATGCNIEETIEMVTSDVVLTHPNKDCIDSTVAYVLALRHLILHDGDDVGAIKTANSYLSSNNHSVLGWLDQAMEGKIDPVTKQIGFVKHGFTLAFHFLAYQYSYEEAIVQTLLKSGDTDTNACIVGGMIGAKIGAHNISKRSVQILLNNSNKSRPLQLQASMLTKYLSYFYDFNLEIKKYAAVVT
ncbi:ADP-ribosylglycohydrolase family protein [Limnohabitans sp. MMS-10A-178]|uniref:ADP-ribosylglycohydrolase family protein n=1 Tax=Limnohabitans sp. MMS-10A-178 TaxID=1835767 RepID=UPI00130500BD|nr:ADP-ribosylglycohydrolase family protein [Limnohabitans sp. MMS-10A-178]